MNKKFDPSQIKGLVIMVIASVILIAAGHSIISGRKAASQVHGTAGQYTPGTYTASAEGFGNGLVTATVTVDDKDITALDIDASTQTPDIGGKAAETLKAMILQNQTADVDAVSGATLTSDAVKAAVGDALAEARGEEKPAETEAPTVEAAAVADGALFAPGTYEATEKGFGGDIKVSVTVTENEITDVQIEGKDETPNLGSLAVEQLGAKIVAAQTPNVDAISGASVSSNAIIKAATAALTAAGADIAKLDANRKDAGAGAAKTEETLEYDVVVVGAGGAGMTAAINAHQAGKSVVIIEKMPYAGGNTTKATGGMNAAETHYQKEQGIEDSIDQFVEDTMKGGYNINDPELVKILAEKSAEGIDWLDSIGAPLPKVAFSGGATNARIHAPEDGSGVGEYLVAAFVKKVEELDIPVMYNTKATEIITKNGMASGIKAESDTTDYTINGKAVILATGGFGANEEFYTKYRPDLKGTVTTNAPGATGDGIVMAEAIGADTVDMEQIQLHPTVEQATSMLITESVRGNGAILVNQEGVRFTNEMLTRDVVSAAELEQTGCYAYVIFDQNLRDGLKAIEKYVKAGITVQGDTIEELAEQIDIDPAVLAKTLEDWNKCVADQNDPEFGRTTAMDHDLSVAPYYAVKIAPGIHHTMGGLKIDTQAEVLDTDGDAIPGLFAAGEVTGGVHGGNRLGGNAVADIVVFGKIAGESACAYVDQMASATLTDGTYTGSGAGFGGDVKATVTVKDGKIEDVELDAPNETANIGGAALDTLKEAVIKAGSSDIDAVSGATLTSNGVKAAVSDALSSAMGIGSAGKPLTFTAGTYEGTAAGYNGDITVKATFTDSAITAIEVVDSKETAHVGDIAFDILIPEIIEANGTGVDAVSGATFSSRGLKNAVNAAAKAAKATNNKAFKKNTIEIKAQDAIEDTWDVVIVGAGGAGISAAAQATQDGNSVLVIEQNAEMGGNTLVSGGQYQSVMKYLVWDESDPDATTGVGYDGNTYNKVMSVHGCIDELKMIDNWSEDEFDADYYKDHEFVAGDAEELSKHGVHADYLPTLKELKKEIEAYLAWAQPKLDAGVDESELTLFSTVNLHIFQTYYGGLRQSADGSEWIYGNVDLVKQFIEDGQDIKPWLEAQGSTFIEDTQPTLIGALWYRENEFVGANADVDGDGKTEEYTGRWGSYFMAPYATFKNGNEKNQLMLRTKAEELIVEDGAVTGVKATMYDGTEVTAHASKGVILATGGYAANIDKVLETNKYWSTDYVTSGIKTTNRSSLVGSGITMAEAAGAATTGEGWTQMMPISWVDNGNLAFGAGNYAVYINPETGKRFVDEGSERDVLSLGEFKNGMEVNGTKGVFVEIYNAEQKLPAPSQLADGDYEGRYYRRTANAEELGKLFEEIGVTASAETVLETIKKYDAAVMGEGDFEDVGKAIPSRTIGNVEKDADGKYLPDTYDLENTTVTVRLMAPSTHHTMGGVVVDIDRHVLNDKGEIIKGLYAAGEVTGGIHGGNRLGGNAITEIIVSGRTAAKAVTADNK